MNGRNVYLNGRIVPADEAVVGISDAGLLHGASAFTTMLARNGTVYGIDRHIARLLETVKLLGLRNETNADGLKSAARMVLEANGLRNARMRITLTPGPVGADKPTSLVTAEPLPDYPRHWYTRGISVVVSTFRQGRGDPTFGYKTGCFLPRVLALREAAAKGADEALWFTADNHLAEACFCNVFLVLDGKVHTPPRDTPVLPGIVRQAVGEICRAGGIPYDDQSPLTVNEMLTCGEMFLTASCSGIRPVVRVERHAVGDETPGQVTKRIMSAYEELLRAECGG